MVNATKALLPFDQLGVDHLFIDEADLFKNLEYYTQLQNVRGLRYSNRQRTSPWTCS